MAGKRKSPGKKRARGKGKSKSKKPVRRSKRVSRKKAGPRTHAKLPVAAAISPVEGFLLADVIGACRYTDSDGRRVCEDGVTQSYCNGKKNATFIPHGRCS